MDCLAYSWDRETTRQLMLKMPQLALNGLELVSKRFANLQSRYQELATQRVEQRVALTILRLARQFGKREANESNSPTTKPVGIAFANSTWSAFDSDATWRGATRSWISIDCYYFFS